MSPRNEKAQPHVVFVKTGWMKTYRGSQTHEAPKGGGKNNRLGLGGGERDNFQPDAFGRLHGYFAVRSGNDRLNLFRVDCREGSRNANAVSPVLVIFVAPHPDGNGAVIVGWYRNAQLFRGIDRYQRGKTQRVEANASDAVLIPFSSRNHRVPRAAFLLCIRPWSYSRCEKRSAETRSALCQRTEEDGYSFKCLGVGQPQSCDNVHA